MKIRLDRLANPYMIFSLAWIMSLSLYSLGWAGIFPKITVPLYIFIATTIVLFGISGVLYNRFVPQSNFRTHNPQSFPLKTLMAINIVLWLGNFIYSGVPLLTGLRDDDFGIPTVKVIAVSLNGFLSVYCYYLYLLYGKKKYWGYIIFCLSFFALTISRGNAMLSITTMFFLWMNVKKPYINFKKILFILVGVVIIAYAFGVAGNVRTNNDIASYSRDAEDTYSSEIILKLGDASPAFTQSIIPNEFFWAYLYITSPLSNLQYNVQKKAASNSSGNYSALFVNEILLDAASKRINDIIGIKAKKPDLVIEQLTVCTALAGSFIYAGWEGMLFYLFIFWLVPILYLAFIGKNSLGVIGVSTLCTVFFFSMFDNMLILSGLTFQLVYPIFVALFPTKRSANTKFN